jgi:hypothetical protein
MGRPQGKKAMHCKTMVQADVPQGRNGKHQLIVTTILNDLDNLQDGTSEQGAARATGAIQGEGTLGAESRPGRRAAKWRRPATLAICTCGTRANRVRHRSELPA